MSDLSFILRPLSTIICSKLSQASVTDLSAKINNVGCLSSQLTCPHNYVFLKASQGGSTPDIGLLKTLFKKFGSGDDQKLNQGDEIQQQAKAYRFNPDDMAPPQVKKQLLDALKWHDDVMRDIISKIEMIPGLTSLLEEFSNALNACKCYSVSRLMRLIGWQSYILVLHHTLG